MKTQKPNPAVHGTGASPSLRIPPALLEFVVAEAAVDDLSCSVNRVSTQSTTPSRLPLAARCVSLLAALAWMVGSGWAADAVLDFRTLIPGTVDAPVYRADGTNRARGQDLCFAQLWAGASSNALAPLGPVLRLGDDQLAGYVWDASTISVVVPLVEVGERVWVQIRAWELSHKAWIPEIVPPPVFTGQSEVFSLMVGSTPTPLIGLKSFCFQPASLRVSRQGERLLLRWSAGDGTVMYVLEEAATIGEGVAWQSSHLNPVLEVRLEERDLYTQWIGDWVATNTLAGSAAFYRIRLLNP